MLKPKFKKDDFIDRVFIYDLTGKYSSDNNPGGFGIQNPKVSDVTDAWLEVTPLRTQKKWTIPVYPDLPDDTCKVGYEILPSQFGCSDGKVESGVVKIGYFITYTDKDGNSQTVSTEEYFLFTAAICCCLEERNAVVTPDNVGTDISKKIIELNGLLYIASRGFRKGRVMQAQDIIRYINLQCNCCI